ncbi:MAG: exo-alpha-sialidase [Spirochaetales bacterium]|jgi:sialidase-1|nr:exo-alpha-sialidase [Spirochaetales bacterium]
MKEIITTIINPCGPDRPRSDTASIVELPSGRLLCAYHSYIPGPDGGGDFGEARIYIRESTDGGLTWQNERLIVQAGTDDLNAICPSLHLIDGVLLFCYLINHEKTVSSTLITWSENEGETFAPAVPIWDHIAEHRFCGYSGFIRLADGRLLLPFQTSKEVWTKNEHITIGTIISSDNGATWAERAHRITLPMRGVMEPSIAVLSDGRLLMSMRSQLGSVFLCGSDDGGETWSLPQTTGLRTPESCTALARVPGSRRLVLFWNDSEYLPTHHHYGFRTPLSAAVSDDEGASWQKLLDIENGEFTEYTNLTLFFTSGNTCILTYCESVGTPDGSFGRDCIRLKAAIIPTSLLLDGKVSD